MIKVGKNNNQQSMTLLNKCKILAIGGKGGGVTEGLLKSLKLAGYTNVVLLEYSRFAAHLYRYKDSVIIDKNPDDGFIYIEVLIDICKKKKINVILPGPTWEAKIISKYTDLFLNEGIIPLVNNFKTIEICDNKWLAYSFFVKNNINTPLTFLSLSEAISKCGTDADYIIKPITGHGSQNLFFAKSAKEVELIAELLKHKKIEFLIQKFLPNKDKEYTIGVVSDQKGKVIQSIVMQRYLAGGYTGQAKVIKHSYINEFCEEIALKIKSKGPLNIQLRFDENQNPCVIEINPRFSGSAPMRAIAGFNEVDMIIKNFVFNMELEKIKYKEGREFYRIFQEIYIDENQKGKIINDII